MQREDCHFRGIKPETEEKYRQAIELYRSTRLSCAEISRTCGVTVSGFQRYLSLFHRDLLLARYDIACSKEEARNIKLPQLRGQLPATRAKYKEAIEACESLDYIEYNVSQIAREFGLDGTNLGRQLRTHYPGIIEWREKVRKLLGLGDNLPRGTRKVCKDQYAKTVKRLRADRYIIYHRTGGRRILRRLLLRTGTAPAVLPQGSGEATHQDTRESRRTETER